MKAIATALLLLTASSALAQQAEPKPDYSRETLLRMAVEAEREDWRGIRFEDNSITFRALGSRWRFTPIMLPFVGTRFTTSHEWPDAFSLTGTAIATSPRAFRKRRELNKELRRIDRVTKPKAKIKVSS